MFYNLFLICLFLFSLELKSQERPFYRFYLASDVGVGILNFDHCHGGIYNELFENDFNDASSVFSNQNIVFIGGGRFGALLDVSDCWYAAFEGSFRSAKCDIINTGITCFNFSENCEQVRYCFEDKSTYIAGIHAHIGFKTACMSSVYGIIGAEYLRAKIYQNYYFVEGLSDFDDISLKNCYGNWGWSLGAGFVSNLYCDLDLRLEVVYANLRNYPFNRCLDFNKYHKASNRIEVKPRLFYGVVSLAYNF